MILTDPSPLLNTEIDNIRLEFKKLLNNLKDKLIEYPDDEDESSEGTEMLFLYYSILLKGSIGQATCKV